MISDPVYYRNLSADTLQGTPQAGRKRHAFSLDTFVVTGNGTRGRGGTSGAVAGFARGVKWPMDNGKDASNGKANGKAKFGFGGPEFTVRWHGVGAGGAGATGVADVIGGPPRISAPGVVYLRASALVCKQRNVSGVGLSLVHVAGALTDGSYWAGACVQRAVR